MFTTFSSATETGTSHNQQYESSTQILSQASRPKRSQVARACVWCRTYRIKCDSSYPCKNCQIKGRKCTDEKGKADVRTFPHAIKEIDRLKQRVKELEEQLKGLSFEPKEESNDSETPPNKVTVSLPANLDPLGEHGGNRKYYNWDFIATRTARSNQQYYGPSSSFYFIGQMTSYLHGELQQLPSNIELTSASQYYSSPLNGGKSRFFSGIVQPANMDAEQSLSRLDEEYLLDMYWQSYNWIYPILYEAEFRAHYNSLWETRDMCRKPSALVDIVLALCMQYGAASIPPRYTDMNAEGSDASDATIAGRWFYRRCQSLITDELECPSITTFQCHLLSVIWLLNASFQNKAHSVMAMGIRTGVILGLHLEPSPEICEGQKSFRKRLWWTLYALEMKMGMELGRPLAVSIGMVTCSIPEDSPESMKVVHGQKELSQTCFNTHFVRLLLATRAVYITFYEKCADVISSNGQQSLYNDPNGLESCADFLQSRIGYLLTWLQQVPDALKLRRKSPGVPFSTDQSPLEFPLLTSTSGWMLRQSLYLELLYHDLSMSLYRPFISFSRVSGGSGQRLTAAHARSCVDHATSITSTIYQMLTETDLLNGWHDTFHWQWNAALSLAGYILAYPLGAATPGARKALSTTITVFELLSTNFVSAISAANVARDLSAKADLLIERTRVSLPLAKLLPASSLPDPQSAPAPEFDNGDQAAASNLLTMLTEESNALQNTFTSASGFGLSLDSFDTLGDIGADGTNVFDFLDFGDATGL